MTEPIIGSWYRVISGPQRGAEGVFDVERTFPTGTFYRLVNPITKQVIGRFRAEQIEATTAPEHTPLVTGAARQQAMDLLTGGRVKA